MAMLELLRGMEIDTTVHGFRSSFHDWAAERTAFPHEVCEMALAHTIPNAAEAAYRRGDLFEKRVGLMKAWADFLAAPPQTAAVVPLRERGVGSPPLLSTSLPANRRIEPVDCRSPTAGVTYRLQ
jgi:hypothetical protein